MADESEYIRKTQDQLGAIIKKPPLTDKLLSKPPFRFLHDVIMAVAKQTGFMEGLYEGDELDAQKVNNEKDAKITFLQKAIDIVQMATGESLAVKPAKIVAGQEANRTNEFLQALAQAAKKGSNADLVKRVLKGEKPELAATGDSGGSAGSNKENRDRSESRKKEEKDSAKKESSKDKKESKERSSSKDRSKEKPKEGSKEKTEKPKDKEDGKAKSSKDKEKEKDKDKEKSRSSSKTRDDDKKKKKDDDDGHKKSSGKSASATTKRPSIDQPEEDDRKRRSSKSAKSSEEKKSTAKSDDKSKKRQSSAAAKLDSENKDDLANGEKESKKRSSSSKREKEKEEKEKEKHNDAGGGLRIDLSFGQKHNGDIVEIDHRIDDESMNGTEEERPRLAANNDDQEATSSLKTGGTIIRSGAARPSSAAGVRPGTATGARPGTAARPAPPRLKRQELGAPTGSDMQVGGTAISDTSGQTGQQIRPPVVIQSEAKKPGRDNDDDDDFIVESREQAGIDALLLNDEDGVADGDMEADEHGQLVRKILETKKELESQLKATTGSEKPLVVFDAQEREKTKKETGKLQELVQQLTRTSHPLAKIVDFLQEDVDSMLKELQQWKQESKKDADLLRQETGNRTGAGVDIETLKNKLTELDQQIVEQSEAITAIRGVILNNEDRIQKMMSAIAKK